MKPCPYCQEQIQDNAVKCKHCGGWLTNNAEDQQKKIDSEERLEKLLQKKEDKIGSDVGEGTEYFYVPTKKLVILCVLSFGFYELYWFYKNWKAVKTQEEKKLSPFWRAVLSVFFCYSLFKRMILSATQKGYTTKKSAGMLAVVYIVFTVLYELPDPFWLISFLTFIPLIFISDAIRFNNAKLNVDFSQIHSLKRIEVLLTIFGIILWIMTAVEIFCPQCLFPEG